MSKGVVISLAVILIILFVIDKGFKNYRKVLYPVIIVGAIVLFTNNRRMSELLNVESYNKISTNFSTGIRIGVYKCSLKLVKENWILGYGLGDSQDALNSCYYEYDELLYKDKYNSHNQYLDILLKSGIIGLLFFLFFLFSNIRNCFKRKDLIAFCVLLFYAFNFLTENILARQTGIILFYFLICFYDKLEKDN
jgi:O-antigen ligase